MKKIGLIISIALLISSLFCVFAGAQGTNVIEAQEIYAEIPTGYEFSPYFEDDSYFTYVSENSNMLFIDMKSNKYVTDGISKLTEKQIQERIIIDFMLEGEEEDFNECVAKFSETSIETINGVKMYKFIGAYAWTEDGLSDNMLSYSGIGGYVTATQENIYYFVIMEPEKFSDTATLDKLMSTVVINGTYFDGDEIILSKDFASFESYNQVLSNELSAYWSEYEDFYDDEYYTNEDYAEIGNITYYIGIAMVAITVIPTLIVLIIAFVLILKYLKNKKRQEELEKNMFAGNIYQQGMPYQPYGTQPYAQPSQQVNNQFAYQPVNVQSVTQPINTQSANAEPVVQKSILNGEIKEDNQ